MKRREFIALVGGAVAAWPLVVNAQQPPKSRKIGFLYPGVAAAAPIRIAALVDGLRDAGLVYGQFEIVMRQADGDPSRMPALAKSLLDAKVDIIFAISPSAVMAVRSITAVPVIASDLETDPIEAGLVASLARPGGNLTGVFFDFPDFAKKWLEVLKETLPQLSSLVVMWDPTSGLLQRRAIEDVTKQVGVDLRIIEVAAIVNLEGAFDEAAQRKPNALMMLSSPVFGTNPERIADLSLKHRLPAVTLFTEFARAGGLMAYGPNLLGVFRQAGTMVAKVLQGAKTADLPVERPSKVEFVINLKTAKALGIELPTSVLLRANEVIE